MEISPSSLKHFSFHCGKIDIKRLFFNPPLILGEKRKFLDKILVVYFINGRNKEIKDI